MTITTTHLPEDIIADLDPEIAEEYTPAQIEAAVERVLAGSKLLSKEDKPDWFVHVVPEYLDLGSASFCVLGQRFWVDATLEGDLSGYETGVRRLFDARFESVEIIRHGFAEGSDIEGSNIPTPTHLLTAVWNTHVAYLRHDAGLG